jgi:chromatin remodeling complex protein RSC6
MASIDIQTEGNTTHSTMDNLKNIQNVITDLIFSLKGLNTNVKIVMKEVERQNRDMEKYRNKKSRVKNQRKENSQPSGITKPVAISDSLAKFLGVEPGTLVPRNQVTKGVSEYVRTHELFDPSNKQIFVLNTKPEGLSLKNLLGNPEEEITYFNLQKYLKGHYIKVDQPLVEAPKPVATADVVVNIPDAEGEKKVKKTKTIIVKKKKEVLQEEA